MTQHSEWRSILALQARTVLRLQELRATSLEALGRLREAAAALHLAHEIEPSSRRVKEEQRLLDAAAEKSASTAASGAPYGAGNAANSEDAARFGNAASSQPGCNPKLHTPKLAEALPHEPPLAPLCVLGGRTGSGKTVTLHALKSLGEQIIDLEGLAEHMGSAFGRVGQSRPQPSNEMYGEQPALAPTMLVRLAFRGNWPI